VAVAFATVGTAKRERKKANKAARQVREFRQQRIDNARRRATKWGTLIVVALGLVVGIAALGGAFSSDDVASDVAGESSSATDNSTSPDDTTATKRRSPSTTL
jgi:hypothetical protein